MMLSDLHFDIKQLNHSMASRAKAVALVIDHPEVLPEIIQNAYAANKNHVKYCWWLEFLNRQDIEILCPFIDNILKGAKQLTSDSAIRPMAKIIETFVLNNYGEQTRKSVAKMMTFSVKEEMVSLSFLWLIDEKIKVASQAYSMTSLYHLGKDIDWVHKELGIVVEQNYAFGSAAYKARARMVLNKLK